MFLTGECTDELPEKDCKKIVDKGKCEDKGDKCMMSCDMCDDAGTTPAGGDGYGEA
jgi:hypothetical protein